MLNAVCWMLSLHRVKWLDGIIPVVERNGRNRFDQNVYFLFCEKSFYFKARVVKGERWPSLGPNEWNLNVFWMDICVQTRSQRVLCVHFESGFCHDRLTSAPLDIWDGFISCTYDCKIESGVGAHCRLILPVFLVLVILCLWQSNNWKLLLWPQARVYWFCNLDCNSWNVTQGRISVILSAVMHVCAFYKSNKVPLPEVKHACTSFEAKVSLF